MKLRGFRRRIATVLSLGWLAAPAFACGPYGLEARFWREHFPDHLEAFLAGEIGVPGERLRSPFLVAAYRHLAGFGVDEDSRRAILQALMPGYLPDSRLEPKGLEVWRRARSGATDRPLGYELATFRVYQRQVPWGTSYGTYDNCLDDAYQTAARTLEERTERFGPGSPEVGIWLAGQDAVFANCSEGSALPAPPDPDWPVPLPADRRYQIAAALFYAERYGEAEAAFRSIAEDETSPWRWLAPYLVARVMARDDRLPQAMVHLEALLADPAYGELHPPARRLLDHLRHRLDPECRRPELSARLTATTPLMTQDLIDFTRLPASTPQPDDLSLWVRAMGRYGDSVRQRARERWRRDPGPLWWLAAARSARPEEGGELLAAAPRLAVDTVGAKAILHERARLLAGQGRLREVEGELGEMLARDDLSVSDRNRFMAWARRLATDLDTYLRLSQRQPAELGHGFDGLPLFETRLDVPPSPKQPRLLDAEAASLLNRLSARQLLQILDRGGLEANLARRVARAAWTRAAVLEEWGTARRLTERLLELDPQLRRPLQPFLAAAQDEAPFVAALTLLELPGLHPDVHFGADRQTAVDAHDALRANGWCPGTELDVAPRQLAEQLLDAADLTESDRAAESLRTLRSSPHALGARVIAWADEQRADPRVPEALHRVVRATRLGCATDTFGTTSRAAFERLHRRYPDSPWTARTPYWFD